MNVTNLVNDLRSEGVRFLLQGNQVSYDAPHGVMTPERIAALRGHKREVLKLLAAEAAASCASLVPPAVPASAPRHAIKRALLLALAERYDWRSLPLKPGISAGGTERMWRTFTRHADAQMLTLATQMAPRVWSDAPIIADLSPAESADVSCMTVDNVFERLRDRGGGLYVDDDRLHYVGPRLGADDPLWHALAAHHDELRDLFTYAPGRRCVFTGCCRLLTPDDRIACREHRRQLDATPMPWDAQAPTSEVQ